MNAKFPFQFRYVRVPADDDEAFEEMEGTAHMPGDVLAQNICKDHFRKNGCIKDVSVLRAQYGGVVDDKMSSIERAASEGTVETFALCRPSKQTKPIPQCGTYLYMDEMGLLKSLPINKRASEIARACGLEVESPFYGDVFIGRVNVGATPVQQENFFADELNAGSAFLLSAPCKNYQSQVCIQTDLSCAVLSKIPIRHQPYLSLFVSKEKRANS